MKMDDLPRAIILASTILALAYFLTHLHYGLLNERNNLMVINTLTGSAKDCSGGC